jgi:hypothetical protein
MCTNKLSDYEQLQVLIEFFDVTLCRILREKIQQLPNRDEYAEFVKQLTIKRPLINNERELQILVEKVKELDEAMQSLKSHVVDFYKRRKSIEEMKAAIAIEQETRLLHDKYIAERSEEEKNFKETAELYMTVCKDTNPQIFVNLHPSKKRFLVNASKNVESLRKKHQDTVNELSVLDSLYRCNLERIESRHEAVLNEKMSTLRKTKTEVAKLADEIHGHLCEIIETAELIINKSILLN